MIEEPGPRQGVIEEPGPPSRLGCSTQPLVYNIVKYDNKESLNNRVDFDSRCGRLPTAAFFCGC